MKGNFEIPNIKYYTMDAGHDYEAIYISVHQSGNQLLHITGKDESKLIGFDKNFVPIFLREYFYRYDSKYETLKYTHLKEFANYPLFNDGVCQKVYKVKITSDLRKYTALARSSKV